MPKYSFVLVPGAGGNSRYWHLLAPRLRRDGHEAIPVSLPADNDTAGLPEYAASVVAAIGAIDGQRVVLVAQSLAGFTAPLVCERVPVALLIFVNGMIPVPHECPGDWWTNTRHPDARSMQRLLRARHPTNHPFDSLRDLYRDVRRSVIEEIWALGAARQSASIYASRCDFTSWPDTPTRVLVGRDDQFLPADFQRRVARERLDIVADEMPGGHSLALTQPDELALRLSAYALAVERAHA